MINVIDPIAQYERKLVAARQQLRGTFVVFINAPDVAEDRQGYLLCGSHHEPERDDFPNFDAFSVGRTESDLREIGESLIFWDAEERAEHAPDGTDYHAIVAAKALAEYQSETLRDASLPLALAVETVFVDTMSEIIVVHLDGEIERFDLDRTPTAKFLAGDTDVAFRTKVLDLVWSCLGSSAILTEPEANKLLARARAAFAGTHIELFELGQVCPEQTADEDSD